MSTPSPQRSPGAKDAASAQAVVVGCDGTDSCRAAMRYAIREAVRRRAEMVVVTTFERPIDPDLDSFDVTARELTDRAHHAAARCLADASEQTGLSASHPRILVQEGRLADALVATASFAAVIVIGAHHSSALEHVLLGSPLGTTTRVLLKHTTVPVVVVPDISPIAPG